MLRPGLRKPRFSRSTEFPPLHLTERDIRILGLAERYRFIHSDHVRLMVDGSRQHLTRRLSRLYHAGMLDRPRAQLVIQHQSNAHMVCCITDAGQAALRERGLPTFASPPRCRGETMALSLSHTLRVTDMMLALEKSAMANGVKFVPHDEWHDNDDSMRLSQMRWSVVLNYDGKRIRSAVMPDGAFALDHGGKRSYFFLEVDRGTMPVSRASAEQTSFRRKVLAYRATRDAGILWKRHEIPGFRVLVVTESPRRMKSLQTMTAELFKTGATMLFCFGQASSLLSGQPGTWQSCSGASVEPISTLNGTRLAL